MKNDITVFGTCRLKNIARNNKLHEETSYTHCTKEVIQLYKFLNGELTIKDPYNTLCFRTAFVKKSPIHFKSDLKVRLQQSNAFLIEICSRKKYIHNNNYLHHLAVDTRFDFYIKTSGYIKNEYVKEIQSDEEIENDIIYIKNMIYPKPLIFVSHYNSLRDGKLIEDRNSLINLIEHICLKHNIRFVNPTVVLKNYSQHLVMSEDLGHYTEFGNEKITEYFNHYLEHEIFN